MVIAFLEVFFPHIYYLRLSGLVTAVKYESALRFRASSVSCIILLFDQSTILTSGFGLMLKKKQSLCSLMRKLTSANPHEASPVTSTNAPNHNLYMCFTGHTNRHTKISASWPSHSYSWWVFPLFFFFLFGLVLPSTDAVQTSKTIRCSGDRGLSTFPTKVQKRQLNMVITCSSSLVVIRHSSSFDHYDVWKVI